MRLTGSNNNARRLGAVILLAMAVIVVGGIGDSTAFGTELPASSRSISQKAIVFVSALAAGDFSTAFEMMDDKMQAALPGSQLEALWSSLVSRMGAFKSLGEAFSTEEGGMDVVYVPAAFHNGMMDFKLVFDDSDLITGMWFVPHVERGETPGPPYADRSKFTEIEISFGVEEWKLEGTLTYPNDLPSFPVVVLVHGSGPNDRDETIGPNKPFRDIAWGLASLGIGVFRYDKRTYVYGPKMNPVDITVEEEVIQDALQAIRTVQNMAGVESVYILGHSLGGMLAPEIAARTQGIGGAILLAGTPRNLEDLILDQVKHLASLEGEAGGPYSSQLPQVEAAVEKIKSGDFNENDIVLGMSGRYLADLHSRDILGTATGLEIPLMVLQGGRDYQVTMDTDFALWQKGLAGKENVTFKVYPHLNHLFMAGEGIPTPAEYEKAGFVDEEVIFDIAAWIGCLVP